MSLAAACFADPQSGVIRSVLVAVDCNTRQFAQGGYLALTGGTSPFQTALTLMLTIYVASVGYRLLFAADGARLSDAPRIALKIGVILALVSSWPLFQTLVFDVVAKAPLQLAQIMSAPLQAGGSALVSDPLGGLQVAYDQLSQGAGDFGRVAGPVTKSYASPEAAAAESLSWASGLLFITTAGLIAVATMAVGVLTALGPIFVALFLFHQTRGLFVGWVRALAAAAIAPVGVWALIVMTLSVLEPWLVALARQRRDGALDVQTAMTAAAIVFVFAAGQLCLVLAAGVVAMGFRLDRSVSRAGSAEVRSGGSKAAPVEPASRPQQLAQALQRAGHADGGRVGLTARDAVASFETRRTVLAPSAAAGMGARLGDAYRRPAFRARSAGSAAR
jgi:type IV secretion system protein VirB6